MQQGLEPSIDQELLDKAREQIDKLSDGILTGLVAFYILAVELWAMNRRRKTSKWIQTFRQYLISNTRKLCEQEGIPEGFTEGYFCSFFNKLVDNLAGLLIGKVDLEFLSQGIPQDLRAEVVRIASGNYSDLTRAEKHEILTGWPGEHRVLFDGTRQRFLVVLAVALAKGMTGTVFNALREFQNRTSFYQKCLDRGIDEEVALRFYTWTHDDLMRVASVGQLVARRDEILREFVVENATLTPQSHLG